MGVSSLRHLSRRSHSEQRVMASELEIKCTCIEAENQELRRLLAEANADRQQLRMKVSTLETRLSSLAAAAERPSAPPGLSVVTEFDETAEAGRPTTSRGRARPSPEDFSNYVVPSPSGAGDRAAGVLSLDEQEPIFSPSPVKPTNCGAAVDVQEVFRMEALFFGT